MNLIIIFGPPAVGKYTVGRELSKITQYPLLHNHIITNFLLPILGSNTSNYEDLINLIRMKTIKKAQNLNLKGLIFTLCWAFNYKNDNLLIAKINERFDCKNVYYIELTSSLDTRISRNKTEPRITNKLTKRNFEISEKKLIKFEKKYIMNTSKVNFPLKNHMIIDNEKLSPSVVAKMIIKNFDDLK